MATTVGVRTASGAPPLHRVGSGEVGNRMVSGTSRWSDPSWSFGQVTAGHGPVTIAWDWAMPDGTRSLDPRWSHLVDLGRRLVWSLHTANRRGRNLKASSLPDCLSDVRYVLNWMARAGYRSFAELDPTAAEEFCDALVEDMVAVEAEDAVTAGPLARKLDVLNRIHEQAVEFADLPAAVMSQHPLGGRTAHAVAATLSSKAIGFIPPVPDGVFLPAMAAALRMVEVSTPDIAELGRRLQRRNAELDHGSHSYSYHLNKLLADYRFDRCGELAEPWHPGLGATVEAARWSARKRAFLTRTWSPLHRFRHLVVSLRSACTIVIQGMLGMRISEVAGLRANPVDESTGWPACVEVRASRTGLNEIFLVRGRLFKGRDAWDDVEWVAGSRPAGSKAIPLPIQAILALHRLFEPWRGQMNSDDLILSFGVHSGIPSERSRSTPVTSDNLREGQKEFLADHVDLPGEYRDWNLSTHQWRKAFALYMVRSDERLLPAVSEHFKHLSLVMTEQGYLGSDVELLGAIDDMATREAARVLFEAVNGRTVVAGRMADVIAENAPGVRALTGTEGTDEVRIERLASALKDDDVRVWPAPWGGCMFRAETARCHHQANGEFDLAARRPHYVQRHAGVCSECANLLVWEAHLPFWQARHDENVRALAESQAVGEAAAAAVARERLKTSAGILRRMKVAKDLNEGVLSDAQGA